MEYSTRWFDSLSDIDVLTRVIAGETLAFSEDEIGVSYVLWNRKKQGFGSSLIYVATSRWQFKCIWGDESETSRARTPHFEWISWQRCLQNACYLYAAEVLGSEGGLLYWMPKPSGYNDEVHFSSYDSFHELAGDMHHESIGIQVVSIWIPGLGRYTTYNSANSVYQQYVDDADRNLYYATN